MSLLALILGAVLSGNTIVEYGKQPIDVSPVEQVSTQTIHHMGFSSGDQRQLMIQKAYDLGGLDFVTMLECESGFNPLAIGDSWRSYGLCQINTRWHTVTEEYKNSWEVQIETCYQKRKSWTKFYWPNRKINWVACKDHVKSRFIIN